jgi:hypothetical protein
VFAFSPDALRLTPNLSSIERGGWGVTCKTGSGGKSERSEQRPLRYKQMGFFSSLLDFQCVAIFKIYALIIDGFLIRVFP